MRTCPIGSINPSVGQRSTTGSLKTDTISSLSSSSTRHWRAEEEDETELRKWLSADTWHKYHACEQMPCGQNAMMQLKGLRAAFVLHAEERHSYSHATLASFGKFGVLREPINAQQADADSKTPTAKPLKLAGQIFSERAKPKHRGTVAAANTVLQSETVTDALLQWSVARPFFKSGRKCNHLARTLF